MCTVSPLGSSTLSPSSPLPRVVGWETNERCVSNLSEFFSSSLPSLILTLTLTPLWSLFPQGQARSSVCWPECYHGQLLSHGSSIRSQPQTHEVAHVVGNTYTYSRVCCQILQFKQFPLRSCDVILMAFQKLCHIRVEGLFYNIPDYMWCDWLIVRDLLSVLNVPL